MIVFQGPNIPQWEWMGHEPIQSVIRSAIDVDHHELSNCAGQREFSECVGELAKCDAVSSVRYKNDFITNQDTNEAI